MKTRPTVPIARGRSGFLWWLASLLAGPIATFLDRHPSARADNDRAVTALAPPFSCTLVRGLSTEPRDPLIACLPIYADKVVDDAIIDVENIVRRQQLNRAA